MRVVEIAARDLTGEISLEAVGRALSDVTDACIVAALDEIGAEEHLTVISMGKLGGRELNYYSDIDLMFIAVGDIAIATKSAEALVRLLGEHTPQGQAFLVDTNLRPEGKSGALVRSLDGYLEYYRRWAKPWEYQALIKARASSGERSVGQEFMDGTRAFVYSGDISEERVASVRQMKERVEEQASRSSRRKGADATDVKLGPGGIRDIEFSVQLMQLVHGGSDPSVRGGNTLDALAGLVDGGYVAEDDAAGLGVAYRWLRSVEHRLQLWQERRVRHLPEDDEGRSRLARVMGFKDSPSSSAADRFDAAHRAVLSDVRNRFEKLFYRPMIESLADTGGPRMSEEGLRERLRLLGFRDVDKAARTLEGLVSGTSRRAKLMRVLTPALLRSLAVAPMPDAGLFHFLRLGEALEGRLDLLGALRDNPPGIAFLAGLLGSGRLLGEVLVQVPEELASIADPDGPGPVKDRERLVREAGASLEWREPADRLDGLRRFKRREMLRVAVADLGATIDQDSVGVGLADLADACLEAALTDLSFPFTVIGMGKLGGRELSYSSDIDVMFVHDGDPHAAEQMAEELLQSIGEVTPEGQAFRIDPGLRPEGKKGPLARSLGGFAEYYERWSEPWEHQALTKARPAAGDTELGGRFLALSRSLAFPEQLSPDAIAQMRHLKTRMERERIPRGSDPRRHLKLGPGGLSDIEFAVQLIQLQHGNEHPELRKPNTIDALHAAHELGFLEDRAAEVFEVSYEFLMKLRNRYFLLAGKPRDALTTKPEELEALGVAMGFEAQPRQEFEELYLRTTRRVRKHAEPLIFGG
ncbi:MAG: [glutamine synthetase] adenylyltransferase / [glutamine synthetase]-adenylyl-L-tyrosine [Actinomycetota bacterium]|nr:[glutamine synthetase] adenylyltransferase / [glutamine synthetase]-adenylyl-L-tyrosine [Actinomycetota bacterium]